LALFLICLSLLALIPGPPATAATGAGVTMLTNAPAEFSQGVFQRSAISTTKVTGLRGPSEPDEDTAGAIQLAPAGTLKAWGPFTPVFPTNVSNPGVASIGNRIYLVGGQTPSVSGSSPYSSAVYWANVDAQTGAVATWAAGNSLPITTVILDNDPLARADNSTCVAGQLSGRFRHSTVGLTTGTNTGYIYVIGGVFDTSTINCPEDLSSGVVQRGTVASDGTVSWTTLTAAAMPSSPLNGANTTRVLGVDSAASTIAQYPDSTGKLHYYLYMIGGKRTYLCGTGEICPLPKTWIEQTLRTVYYTEIDITTGNLIDPDTSDADTGVWKRDTDIQFHSLPGGDPSAGTTDFGLWEATASATAVTSNDQSKSAIFLAGGAHNVDRTSIEGFVYRADVGAKGTLNWGIGGADQTFGSATVAMGGRLGMSSLVYNNKLYLIGGRTTTANATTKSSVPTIFLDDNLDAMTIVASNPIIGQGDTDTVLGANGGTDPTVNSRAYTGVALVRAQPIISDPNNPPPSINSAWVFVIGGAESSSGTETNTIYRGEIGGAESLATNYTLDGWYYSAPFQTSYVFGSASGDVYKKSRLLAFYWAADLSTARAANADADIRMYFRTKTTGTGRCTADSDKFRDSDLWQPLDGFSGDSRYSKAATSGALYNQASLTGAFADNLLTGNCLQFRAQLWRGASSSIVTPSLLSVAIKTEVAGNADLNIPTSNGFSLTNNDLSTLVMRVQNLNVASPSETISVEQARMANIPGLTSPDTTVYVNLCMTKSSDLSQPAPDLTLPNPNSFSDTTLCRYYAEIYSYELDSGTVIDLLAPNPYDSNLSRWRDNLNGYARVDNIKSVFSATGNYKIGLILDTGNYVPEVGTGENNNQSAIISFSITAPIPPVEYKVSLPLVIR